MPDHLTEEEAAHWRTIAANLGEVSKLMSEAQFVLFAKLGITEGPAKDVLDIIEEAANGAAYMFDPQPEWMGGTTTGPNPTATTKYRPPHIARPSPERDHHDNSCTDS